MDKQKFYENARHGTPRFPIACFRTNSDSGQFQVPLHWHNSVEIMMMFGGSADVQIDSNVITTKSSDILFINSGELHKITSESKDLAYSTFIFPIKSLTFLNDDSSAFCLDPIRLGNLKFNTKLKTDHLQEKVRLILDEVLDAAEKKYSGYELTIKAHFLEIIALCIRYGELYENTKSENTKSERLKEILKFTEKNFSSELDIPFMAEKFHMSEKYFSRYFRVSAGQSFTEYLNNIRIEKSLEQLRNTDDTIMAIALDCGYENVSYFNRVFKKYMSMSPVEYRKSIKIK